MDRDHDINAIINALYRYHVDFKIFNVSERVVDKIYVEVGSYSDHRTIRGIPCVVVNMMNGTCSLETLSERQAGVLRWSKDHEFIDRLCEQFKAPAGSLSLSAALEKGQLMFKRSTV